jgi:mono/diheme cytochrome c family protein
MPRVCGTLDDDGEFSLLHGDLMNRSHQSMPRRAAHLLNAVVAAAAVACAGGDRPQSAADTAAPTVSATPAAQSLGAQTYQICVTCHQADGQGLPPSFPPLAGSEFATAANPAVPIRIVLRGMQGPVTVKGVQYNGVMAPFGTGVELSDEQVAAVLTYVRTSWGNSASEITPQQVAAERPAARAAGGAATAEELRSLMQ